MKEPKKPRGRPTVMTPEVLGKILEAKSYGANNDEACVIAGINPDSLYAYKKENPAFSERLERVGSVLVVQANARIGKEIAELPAKDAIDLAKWVIGQHKDKQAALPPSQVNANGTTVTLNIGNITAEEANDLTDDELALVTSRQKTLQQVLADRKAAPKNSSAS